MKILPASLQAHLDSGTTTLCWCWSLTRQDSIFLGFTDFDENLVVGGKTYEASSGFTATEMASAVGLSADNLEAQGALRSDRLNEDDLRAGLFDDAQVEIWRVNWQDTEQRVLMHAGSLGEIRRGRQFFAAEIRGLSHYLQQPKGRLLQYGCDAVLGDSRCAIDLNLAANKGTSAVVAVTSNRIFTVSGLSSFANNWFGRGVLLWTSGANNGRSMEVKLHTVSGSTVLIELWQAMTKTVGAGDAFTVTAGCDKQFETCKEKFSNGLNFGGFPHIPGNDFVTSYPNKDDPENDGESMN